MTLSQRVELKQRNDEMFKNIKFNDQNYHALSQNQNNIGSKYESSYKNPPGLIWQMNYNSTLVPAQS
jgi:hypothetical protein